MLLPQGRDSSSDATLPDFDGGIVGEVTDSANVVEDDHNEGYVETVPADPSCPSSDHVPVVSDEHMQSYYVLDRHM